MNVSHEATSAVDQDQLIRSIDRETEALLGSLLGGFLEIDLQFELVLDEFTGGHVITHLSREADRMADELLEATGRPVPPIDAQRQWDVEPGGLRPAAVLIEDFVESSARLQEAMAGVHDWSSLGDDIREIPARRLTQLVVHHGDLNCSWETIPERDAAFAVSQLSTVMAAELGDIRFVIQADRPLVSSQPGGGETVITGDARALLAWASGRIDGVDTSYAVDLPGPARRTWF